MTDLTFEELSVEYRKAATPHPVRQDLYPAIRDLIERQERALDDAIVDEESDTIIDGLRERFIKTRLTAHMVADARFDMIVRLRSKSMIQTTLTPEERAILDQICQLREGFVGVFE